MKKALAILLALSMVFAAFADEPATNYSVAEFKGEASLEYVYDLDNEASGFVNSESATLKLNLLNGGNKATSGDGIWGELEIKIDTPDALENPGALSIGKTASVEKAKIHFVEGDFGVALNLKKPGLSVGDVVLPTAASVEKKSAKYDVTSFAPKSNETKIYQLETALKDKQDAYDAAVHAAKMLGTDPSKDITVKNAKDALDAAQILLDAEKATPEALTAGFAVEFTSSAFDATIKVLDNGVQKDKEYGFGADVSVKAIENAGLKAGFAYAYEKTAFAASADYKYAIDEKLYVKPVVAFAMMDTEKQLAAGVLFGWGADGQKPEFALLHKGEDNEDKFADGVSVTYANSLAENDKGSIIIGLYDSTLVAGLKVGAEYTASLEDFGKGFLATGVKYSTDIDILTVSGEFGYATTVGTKDSDNYVYSAEVKTDDIIDNTTVYAKWTDAGKNKDGKITVGAKIAF